MDKMHELNEMLCREVNDMTDKIRAAGGKITAQDLDMLDKLTHAVKSVKTVLAMDEYEDDEYDRDHYAQTIARVCSDRHGRGIRSANARLIAAAPDLLEALRWYESRLGDVRKITPEGEKARNELDRDFGDKARAAIAKATGEAS